MAADEAPTVESREEFDVDAYAAAALKQGKGLDDLETELGEQLRSIRQELYSLIDERYEDFLGLSTSLTGIDATINSVKEPLTQITTEIQTTHTELAAKLEYVDSRMAYRSEIRDKKQVLRLFIDLSQLLDRVDAVLKETDELTVGSAEFIKCLERAAVDLSQIRYFSNKGAEYPFVVQSAERISRIEDVLLTALDHSLTHCISEYLAAYSNTENTLVVSNHNTVATIAQCLGAYSTVEEHGRAEEVIRQRMVRPFVQSEVLGELGSRKGMGIDSNTFASLLQKLLDFVSHLAVPLVQGIELHFPASGYMLESSVFWREIATNLIESLPLLFVPGMPDHFHRNYLATCRFMREFAVMFAVSKKGGGASYADYVDGGGPVASEPSYIEFNRKWQLSAYFSIRKKQIIDAVEGRNSEQTADVVSKRSMVRSPELNGRTGGLTTNSRPGTPSSAASLTSLSGNLGAFNDNNSLTSSLTLDKETIMRMQGELGLHTELATRAILAIRQCWLPSVYIEPLASRFWQLTVQLMLWYQQAADQRIRQLIRRNAELGGSSALESAEIDQLLHHICDIYELKALILEQTRTSSNMVPATVASISTGSSSDFRGKVLDSMEGLVVQMFRPLEDTTQSTFSYMAATIVSTSCNNLASQLRRTTSQFRHTNRNPPSSASPFVGKLFAPLSALETKINDMCSTTNGTLTIGLDSADGFLSVAKNTLRLKTCEGISCEFTKACGEALSSISKTEASLQRLRKSKGGASTKLDTGITDDLPVPVGIDMRGKVPTTDNEKIRRQIWLDVTELSRLIEELGSQPHRDFVEFVQLIMPLGS
ncbi:hypothetical protein H4S08_001801 [Coemansia sp. RSA 1365]|nr:hypothetical protein H4S08_001801 [Coemansia sp. RSA 1365]